MPNRLNFSRLFSLALSLIFISVVAPLHAHEVTPPVLNITVDREEASLELNFNAEIFLAGIDASTTRNTNETDQTDDYDALRALAPQRLEGLIEKRADQLIQKISLTSGGATAGLSLDAITTENNADLTQPRLTTIMLSADLPQGNDDVIVALSADLGAYIIRQNAPLIDEDDLYADFIAAGLESQPIPRQDIVERSWQETFTQYIVSGIAHIIPKGLDHIVFIMGLYFFSPRLRPLLMQVTVFTLAHSVTLAMATLKLVNIPASIVEPLIALSIAWIGVENILRPKIGVGRLTVIFVFGLLHGLGFAFVLGEVGLSGSAFVLSLVAFNIGVEVGQLLVLAPLVILGLFVSHRKDYRKRLEIPASAAIAAIGLYWFFERVLG